MIPLAMLYLKHDTRRWNASNFLKLDMVSWYVNFSAMSLLHTISIYVYKETIGKESLRNTMVKMAYKMYLNMLYPKHDPIRWNTNRFVNPDVIN